MEKKLSHSELIELVEKLWSGEGTEEESIEWMHTIKRNVPHPEVTTLLFWSKEPLTAEEAIDKALAYKPIIL